MVCGKLMFAKFTFFVCFNFFLDGTNQAPHCRDCSNVYGGARSQHKRKQDGKHSRAARDAGES